MSGRRGSLPVVASVAGAIAVAGGMALLKAVARRDRMRHGTPAGDLAEIAASSTRTAIPCRTRSVDTPDGARLRLVETGPTQAPPIVLLHGVTLSSQLWHHQLDDFAHEHRVVAPDWRGHGDSKAGDAGFGLPVLADDLARLLEALDLRNAVVVGHSMGGMALMRFCADRRAVLDARVRALVFADTAVANVAGGVLGGMARLAAPMGRKFPALAGSYGKAVRGDLGYAVSKYAFGQTPDPVAVELTRQMLLAMDPAATGASSVGLLGHDCRKALRSVRLPTLVIVGDHDRVTPPARADEIVGAMPHAELVTIAGAGHLPMLERREEFGRAVLDFVGRLR